MRTSLLVIALATVAACNADSSTGAAANPLVGAWALQTYNGKPLPYTGTPVGNAIDKVIGGEITFGAGGSYTIGIDIVHTVDGTMVFNQNYSEIGAYSTSATGVILRPNDVFGGSGGGAFLPPPVPVTVSGNTLSFLQQGKELTFAKR